MNLLSIIAIIATVLTCWLYAATVFDIVPTQEEINRAKLSKRVWLKMLCVFSIENAPIWRKILLRQLLSIFSLTAIVCGFYTILIHLSTDVHIVWRCANAFILACLAWVTIGFFCTAGIWCFSETISNDFFGLEKTELNKPINYKRVKIAIMVLNSAILCLWLAMFISGLFWEAKDIFTLIGLATFLTVIISLLLFVAGAIVYKILLGIFYLIRCYIKWLVK